jgi:alpha-glucuronidase
MIVLPRQARDNHKHTDSSQRERHVFAGQQIHAVSLTSQWETYLDFDTYAHGPGTTVGSVLSGTPMGCGNLVFAPFYGNEK